MNSLNIIEYIIGCVGLTIVVFLVFREVLTWYWKINKMVDLLEKIEKNTRVSEVEEEIPTNSVSENQPAGSVWRNGKWESK
jgi:hypothetical protein